MEKKSIVKQSSNIKDKLRKRIEELGLNYTQIVEDSKSFGISGIKVETISRYFNGKNVGALTEEGIIFLCFRFGVPISLLVGKPKIADGKLTTEIPPYNEKQCIEQVKKMFPKTKVDGK